MSHDTDNIESSGATGGGGGGMVYVSSYQAHHQSVFAMVRQACVRSLSVEVRI